MAVTNANKSRSPAKQAAGSSSRSGAKRQTQTANATGTRSASARSSGGSIETIVPDFNRLNQVQQAHLRSYALGMLGNSQLEMQSGSRSRRNTGGNTGGQTQQAT